MTKYAEIKQIVIFEFNTTVGHQKKHGLDAVSYVIDDWTQGTDMSKVIELMIVNKLLQLGVESTSSFFVGTQKLLNSLKNELTLMDIERELSRDDMADLLMDLLKTNNLMKDSRVVLDPKPFGLHQTAF